MAEPNVENPPATDPQTTDGGEWRQYIPEETKGAKFWENVADMPTLVKNYANAQQFLGASVRIPGDDATPEQVASFYKKLGRPDDPKGYQIADVPGIDKVPQETIEGLKQIAFDAGTSQKQFTGVLSGIARMHARAHEDTEAQMIAQAHETAETLKRVDQWGANYERNMALARRAIVKLGSEDTLVKIENKGLGSDIPFMNLMYQVGRNMSEHGMIPGDVPGIPDANAAKARIAELKKQEAYWDRKLPGHRELVEEVSKLYQVAHE